MPLARGGGIYGGWCHPCPIFYNFFYINGSQFGTSWDSNDLIFYMNNEKLAIEKINGMVWIM